MVDELRIFNLVGNSFSPKMCYFIHKNKFYFQGKFNKKSFKYNISVRDKFYIFDIKITKNMGSKDFFPKETNDKDLKTLEKKVLSG